MPLFKSFRSKSSIKSSSASIMSSDNNDRTTEFGGVRSPSSATLGSRKAPREYASMGRNGGSATMPTSASKASVRTTQSTFVPSNGGGQGAAAPVQASGVVAPMERSNSVSSVNGPRPSELFAGKGVQWDTVKLAGPGSAPAVQERGTQNTTEDLQAFLKQRRQWKPTFNTEESAPRTAPSTDLSKLTFATDETMLNSGGLMSFEDLDKSHQRKQQLLGDKPLGASVWDDPESSKAGAAKAAAAASSGATLNVSRPEMAQRRTSSFRSRKGPTSQTNAGAIPTAPKRISSQQQFDPITAQTNGNGQTSAVSNATSSTGTGIANLPPPITTTPTNTAKTSMPPPPVPAGRASKETLEVVNQEEAAATEVSPAQRPSMETTGGFATPEAHSRAASTQDHSAPAPSAAVEPATPVMEEPQTPKASQGPSNGN